MSVVGFDLGNESCVVAVARQRGIDVVLNDESKRETPAIVCFGEKQRFIGTAGAASSTMNPKNCISQIKRLIGKPFSDPELQRDLATLPFLVTEGSDGYPLIHAQYLGNSHTFTPTQVLAVVLSNLKSIAESNLKTAVADCCIGIPAYFTDLQRRSVLDAAAIAGLHPLRLFHETTATALSYGIYKTDLPETEQTNVVFVDIGHASMQVSVAGFRKGGVRMLSHAYDASLGGRDFDGVLFDHFVEKFGSEYGIDVRRNARASLRLRAAVEKLKKMLSANPEAPMNIECLMEEKDVHGIMRRDEFEHISAAILERVTGPLERAIADAGLSVGEIAAVELVGSGSRVPSVLRRLTEFFGKEPRRTMNASESVARGCALQCAVLSPTFKVREFQVHDVFPFSVSLVWSTESNNEQSTVVFPRGNAVPSVKALTFYRLEPFTVDVQYTEAGGGMRIGSYTVGPFRSARGDRSKVKVKARLNLHGIVSVESAVLLEEEDVVDSLVMDVDESPVSTDVRMPDAGGLENGAVEADGPDSEKAATVAGSVKKKIKKTNVAVTEVVYGAMAEADLQKAVEREFEMALQDRVMEETKDKKNAVEAYVYDMRNKLAEKYREFVTEGERDGLVGRLQEVEDWLYEDGEDETKGVYVAKLEELRKEGDPIEKRFREHSERATVTDQFTYCARSYREAALSSDPKFEHIDPAERQKVLSECSDAEAWLREKRQVQDTLPKHVAPVLLSADVKKKAEALDRFCRPIMMKPKPAPAAAESPAAKGAERRDGDGGSERDCEVDSSAAAPAEVAPPTEEGCVEPMELEKGDGPRE